MAKRGLGKGLDALIGRKEQAPVQVTKKTQSADPVSADLLYLPVKDIEPNPKQARKKFDEVALGELAESIKASGVLQPLAVTRKNGGGWLLIAGERRLRASKIAGIKKVPVRVVDAKDDQQIAVLSLVENLQREDLDAVEEARAYRMLADEYGLTQDALAKAVAKSRPYVANSLRLLDLPKSILDWIGEGRISAGHGRAILRIPDKKQRLALAEMIVAKGLSVRDTERIAERWANEDSKEDEPDPPKKGKGPYGWLADELKTQLGTKVEFKGSEKNGKLVIHYFSESDLTRIIELLKG